MIVIGLDLSLKATGWCVLKGSDGCCDPSMVTGRIDREVPKDVEGKIRNLLSIASAVSEVVENHLPDLIVIEAPAVNQKWQAAAIGELHGVIKTTLYQRFGIVPWCEQATKMRNAVVGKIGRSFSEVRDEKGKLKKQVDYGMVEGKSGRQRKATIKDIIEARLREDRGVVFPTQDEMDAYVCSRYGWDVWNKDGH